MKRQLYLITFDSGVSVYLATDDQKKIISYYRRLGIEVRVFKHIDQITVIPEDFRS